MGYIFTWFKNQENVKEILWEIGFSPLSLSTKFSSPNPKQINTIHFLFHSRVPLCLEKQNKYIIFSLFFYTKVAMYRHNVYCVLHLKGKF